jgi:hypothetical protein
MLYQLMSRGEESAIRDRAGRVRSWRGRGQPRGGFDRAWGRWSLGVLFSVLVVLLLSLGGADARAVGTNCGAGEGSGTVHFDCRVYELVSPVFKEGFPVQVTGVSESGSQLLAQSPGTFSAPESTTPFGQEYEIDRGSAGWEAAALAAPSTQFAGYAVEGLSPDFQDSLWFASPPQSSISGFYVGLPRASLSLAHVGPAEAGSGRTRAPAVLGESSNPGSTSVRHILFRFRSSNIGEPSPLWPGDTTAPGGLPSLYEYEYSGREVPEPRLVGVDNVGAPAHIGEAHLISDCGTYLGSFPEGDAYNALSAGGGTVFFTSAAGGCGGSGPPVSEVYARVGGVKSVAISSPAYPLVQGSGEGPDECDASCEAATPRAGLFAGASEDGSKVFFITSRSLLNRDKDTGPDLYEAEIGGVGVNARIDRLVQVSFDPHVGGAAGVLGVARVSKNGSHVYFVAEGVLTGANREGKSPVLNKPNLYVFSRECAGGGTVCASPVERTVFVGTLSGSDGGDWSSFDRRTVQVTPDGRFVCFQSRADLTPDQEGRAEAGQVFEYDAQTETLVRVSKGQEGYNEDGNSSVFPATIPMLEETFTSYRINHFTRLAISADGSRVFFSSPAALTRGALNGVVVHEEEGAPVYALNVYEYHDGQVGLISGGHDIVSTLGESAVELIGTDETGLDVFFRTADRLVAQDTDDQVDVYDARIGGGFPGGVLAPCGGDSCQDPAERVPSLLGPVTSSVPAEVVSGDVVPSGVLPKKKAKPKPKRAGSRGRRHKPKSRSGHARRVPLRRARQAGRAPRGRA